MLNKKCSTFWLTLSLVVLSYVAWAKDWQPANGPLMTSWTKNVTPDNVWPEYPRPQMIRDNWKNLNGLWNYAIIARDASKPTAWDGQILVPFCAESALSGVMKKVLPDQCLWYHRMFQAPTIKKGKHMLLHFGAVDWKTTVWVNGTEVGTHTGGYDPFTFDVTEALKDGQNELVIKVWDPTNTGTQPKGKQNLKPGGIKYTAVTGIWQTVWMETVPAIYIQSLKLVADIDRGVLQVTVNASGRSNVKLIAKEGGRKVAEAKGQAGQVVELTIKDAKLWSPDSPNLYDLEVSLVEDARVMDRVASYCGMRKIEVKKDGNGINRLFLNNKVLFQYGPLDQGWWPDGLYTPATEEAMKYDIAMIKKFGMNMARKHVKIESARWYYTCDKLGLMVWQDMPHGDSGRNDESKANFRVELKAMMNTLQNFPCIVMWMPFNEGWGQHDTKEIAKWIQAYDPTRLVDEESGWTWDDFGGGNVADMHNYPGPAMRDVENTRACVLGESGGLGFPVEGHLWQVNQNWGYTSYKNTDELTDAYVNILSLMRPLIAQGLSAVVYTQTSDVETEANGLMTYDRKVVKMNLDRMAEAAHKLYLEPPMLKIIVPTSQNQHQQWRYTAQEPPSDWFQSSFDDSTWKTGPGGFGTSGKPGAPGAVVGTTWDSSDIWIRRTFELNTVPTGGNPVLQIKLCESAPTQVYLNGKLVWEQMKRTYNYDYVPLSADAVKMLKSGVNTIAIHCQQKKGTQYVDAGFVDMIVAARDFYVSPNGSDTNPGTINLPFATPEKAIAGVRRELALKKDHPEPINVLFKGGVYRMSAPLKFTPTDSGTASAPVTYAAVPGEHVVFSGGVLISGSWTQTPGKPYWQINLPKAKDSGWIFNSLTVNGLSRLRARFPRDGEKEFRGEGTEPGGDPMHSLQYRSGDFDPNWTNPTDIDVVLLYKFTPVIHRVREILPGKHSIRFQGADTHRVDKYETTPRYYLSNVFEALTEPGEWYLNRKTGVLYYYPMKGEDLSKVEVEVPVIKSRMIELEGDLAADRPVEYLNFRDLHFRSVDSDLDRYDGIYRQGHMFLDAAFFARDLQHSTFERCEFSQFGEFAMELADGCRDITVRQCHFWDLGAGAMQIGVSRLDSLKTPVTLGANPGVSVEPRREVFDIRVDNNLIHRLGMVWHGCYGIVNRFASGTKITHNEIFDTHWDAIGLDARFEWKGEKYSHGNEVAYNQLHDLGLGYFGDAGAIYQFGPLDTHIHHNLIHDTHAYPSYKAGFTGIYLDETSRGAVVENNLAYNIDWSAFLQNYGDDNVFRNNIGAFARNGFFHRDHPHGLDQINYVEVTRNIYITRDDNAQTRTWEPGSKPAPFDYNIYFSLDPKAQLTFAGKSFADWKATGRDSNSVVMNPGCRDPDKFDFSIPADSPACKEVGFIPFTEEIRKAGLYGDTKWRDAIKLPPPRKFLTPWTKEDLSLLRGGKVEKEPQPLK